MEAEGSKKTEKAFLARRNRNTGCGWERGRASNSGLTWAKMCAPLFFPHLQREHAVQ